MSELRNLGVFENFFDRRGSHVDIAQTIFAEGVHPQFDRFLFQHYRRSTRGDQFADWVRDIEQLVESATTTVTGLSARGAATTGEELLVAQFMSGDPELIEDGFVGLVWHFAVFANCPDQTLGEDTFERGRNKEWLATHVNKTGHSTRGIVRMESGENQVTGESSLNADRGGFFIPHFPDHDPVWILAEERAENSWEIETDGVIDGDLDDAVDVILDGIFRGEELGVDGIDPAQRGVEGGRFSGTGRPGDDENAVWLLDRVGDVVVNVVGETKIFKREVDG